MRNKPLLLGCLLATAALGLHAQSTECTYTLEGIVIDEETKEALPVAAVWLVGPEKGTATNEKGRFAIANLCPGTYIADIHYLGYEENHISVTIPLQKPLVVLMEENQLLIDEVVVQGQIIEPDKTQSETRLSERELAKVSGKSLGESLQGIAGVTVLKTGPTISKPIINGLHSNRIVILNNGLRQEGQQWGTEHAPEIDPLVAQQITVVKGAAAVRYGPEAIGGTVIVTPPPLPYDHEHVHGNFRLMGSDNGGMGAGSASLEGGLGDKNNWGWRAQGTGRRSGDFRAPDYMLTNTGLKEVNFSGALGYKNRDWASELYFSRFSTELGILRSAHIGNLTDLLAAFERETPLYVEDFSYTINNPKQQVSHDLLKYTLTKQTTVGAFSLVYGFQRNRRKEFDIRRGGRDNVPALDMDLTTHSADAVWEQKTWKKLRGQIGTALVYQENRNVPGTGIQPLIPNYNSTTASAFAIERWMEETWEVEAGLRFDHRRFQVFTFDEQNNIVRPWYKFDNMSATVGTILKPNPSVKVSSNLGTAWRPPNVSELYSQGLHHGAATIEEGDTSLSVETAFKWIGQLQITKKKWSADVSLFAQHINNYIYLEPQPEPRLTIRGAFPVYQYVQTDVVMAGVDAAFTVDLGKTLDYTAKGSVIRARDITDNDYLIFMPGDRLLQSVTWSYPFLSKRTFFTTLSHNAVRTQNRFPADVDFINPPKGYQLLGLELGYGGQLFNNDYEMMLEVTNALNTAYREYLNRFRYFSDELGRTISIRFNYKF